MLAVYLGAALVLALLILPLLVRPRRARHQTPVLGHSGPELVRLRPYTPTRKIH